MKKYKCHKEVLAMPMTRFQYNLYRGWEMPSDEDGADKGYLVEYLDGGKSNHHDHKGYISWSPKDVFEAGYTEIKLTQNNKNQHELCFDFGEAICALKTGHKVTRIGWNGVGMFLYYVPANKYPANGNLLGVMKNIYENDLVPYRAYIAIKNVDDTVTPWAPSIGDALAEDWYLIHED